MAKGRQAVDAEKRAIFRENLIKFRHELDATQQEVADAAEISIDTLRAYENGRRAADMRGLLALAAVFGRKVDDFFETAPPPADPAKLVAVRFKVLGDLDEDLLAEIEAAVSRVNRAQMERAAKLKKAGRHGRKL